MSIKLYTDKVESFECNVAVTGASLKESQFRAILKTNDKNLLYEGAINSSGKAEVVFPKLKNILSEGDYGEMVLELIADDAYFQPYSEKFIVETSKKATVEIIRSKPSKPVISIRKVTPESQLIEVLKANGVTKKIIMDNKQTFGKVLHNYYQDSKLSIGYNAFLKNIIGRI